MHKSTPSNNYTKKAPRRHRNNFLCVRIHVMTSFFVSAIGASVVANPPRQLWPRAISEELLKGESVSIACNFAFDDLQALPAVVQARSRRWLSSMRSSCCNGLSAGRIDRGTITIDDRKAPLVAADETYTLRVEAGRSPSLQRRCGGRCMR